MQKSSDAQTNKCKVLYYMWFACTSKTYSLNIRAELILGKVMPHSSLITYDLGPDLTHATLCCAEQFLHNDVHFWGHVQQINKNVTLPEMSSLRTLCQQSSLFIHTVATRGQLLPLQDGLHSMKTTLLLSLKISTGPVPTDGL